MASNLEPKPDCRPTCVASTAVIRPFPGGGGSGFRVEGLGSRVQLLGLFGVWGAGSRV